MCEVKYSDAERNETYKEACLLPDELADMVKDGYLRKEGAARSTIYVKNTEGKNEMPIAVGFNVNSECALQFRKWRCRMVQNIMRDIIFLSQKSEPATEADRQVALDLLDTLKAHENECVGMAANMIGVKKRIIVVNMGPIDVCMLNPHILKKTGPYDTEEGCLSLSGSRKTKRYHEIELEYQDLNMRNHRQKFIGWTAQIIQHECDHLEGIII